MPPSNLLILICYFWFIIFWVFSTLHTLFQCCIIVCFLWLAIFEGSHLRRAKYSILFWSTKVLFFCLSTVSVFPLRPSSSQQQYTILSSSICKQLSGALHLEVRPHVRGPLSRPALFGFLIEMRLEWFSRGDSLSAPAWESQLSICNSNRVVRAASFRQELLLFGVLRDNVVCILRYSGTSRNHPLTEDELRGSAWMNQVRGQRCEHWYRLRQVFTEQTPGDLGTSESHPICQWKILTGTFTFKSDFKYSDINHWPVSGTFNKRVFPIKHQSIMGDSCCAANLSLA